MKAVCFWAIIPTLAIFVIPTTQSEVANAEEIILPTWWGQVFGGQPRVLRSDRGKEERFWATRGKRAALAIKPNGLFQPISFKRSAMKPNGFFMMAGKRNSFKPNSLFSMTRGKRSFMKPNGLFASFDNYGGKRSISLKPNGLFSMTKRSPHPLFEEVYPVDEGFYNYNQYWGTPNGLFGAFKRSMKPNGLFSINKRSLDYDEYDMDDIVYDNEVEDDEEDVSGDEDEIHLVPAKREPATFWATRGKRGEMFWATRGKRGAQNFWAVRG